MAIKRAILATGGMDSTVLMYRSVMRDGVKPTIITVDYGHDTFNQQMELLSYHCEVLGLEPPVPIKIEFYDYQTNKNSGLFVKDFKPAPVDPSSDEYYQENKTMYADSYIEGRNLIMLAYALGYCSTHKIDELQVGYYHTEKAWKNRRSYKILTADNSAHFVDMLNLIAFTGYTHHVRINAPFITEMVDKSSIFKEGNEYNIDWDKTHSCYWVTPCGVCDNCVVRARLMNGETEVKD